MFNIPGMSMPKSETIKKGQEGVTKGVKVLWDDRKIFGLLILFVIAGYIVGKLPYTITETIETVVYCIFIVICTYRYVPAAKNHIFIAGAFLLIGLFLVSFEPFWAVFYFIGAIGSLVGYYAPKHKKLVMGIGLALIACGVLGPIKSTYLPKKLTPVGVAKVSLGENASSYFVTVPVIGEAEEVTIEFGREAFIGRFNVKNLIGKLENAEIKGEVLGPINVRGVHIPGLSNYRGLGVKFGEHPCGVKPEKTKAYIAIESAGEGVWIPTEYNCNPK